MTVAGADPAYPPHGWGDGCSPIAEGPSALEVRPSQQIDAMTDTDFSRRKLRSNYQEIGLASDQPEAEREETPTATITPDNYPDTSPVTGRSPSDDYGVDDIAHTAAPQIRT